MDEADLMRAIEDAAAEAAPSWLGQEETIAERRRNEMIILNRFVLKCVGKGRLHMRL
jgi:hypothetical protein